MRCSAHFCEGRLDVAFVFSTPGAEENRSARPVAGVTGKNLAMALPYLHAARRDLFPSLDRYDYRITNAWSVPTAVSLGNPASEASDSEIQEPLNVRRVHQELAGCGLAILSGDKAKLLARALTQSGHTVVGVPHVGNQGLSNAYREIPSLPTPLARRQERVRLWAEDLLEAISIAQPA
jgi:hypothetical protein